MYKIIGGDQHEYGPVSAEEVRRWIAEGRLNAHSLAQAENTTGWKPLSEFPEFADALTPRTTPPPLGVPSTPPASPELWTAEILARQPAVPIGLCLTRSLELLKANFGLLFMATLLVWLAGLVQFVPFIGLLYRVFIGVLFGGLCLVFLKRIRNEPATPGEAFVGFNVSFGQLVLVGVVIWVLTAIGFYCLCFLPGIYLMVAWIFAVPLVADKRLEFWSAMELSRKVVTRVWFPIFLLLIIAFLPMILVNVATGVKVTEMVVPLIHGLVSAGGPPDLEKLMKTITHIQAASFFLEALSYVVWLINLPFALGALMYAYESLFGPRNTPAA
jgi:hypothetical protein